MSKNKKRGTSFVMVVILVAFIFTTGSAMLTLVNYDYKARTNRSEKIKNLYGADSGLNLVSNIIMKQANLAVLLATNNTLQSRIYGNETGYMYYQHDAIINTDAYKSINQCFKEQFIAALTDQGTGDIDAGSQSVTTVQPFASLADADLMNSNNLIYAIKNKLYFEPKTKEDFGTDTTGWDACKSALLNVRSFSKAVDQGILKTSNDPSNNDDIFKKTIGDDKKSYDIKITGINISKPSAKNDTNHVNINDYWIELKVSSTFWDSNTATGSVQNKRTINTTFKIKAPDFQQALQTENYDVNLKKYSFMRAITTDGSVIYNGDSKDSSTGLKVTGGIWAKGENDYNNGQDKIDEITGRKYGTGLILNKGKLEVVGTGNSSETDENKDGDVLTNGSVTMVNNTDVSIGNVYARNVYMGPTSNQVTSQGNNLTVSGNIVTNNDMVLNSKASKMTMNNYYGISDKTSERNDTSQLPEKRASSIIVNTIDNDNSILINKDAFISGVAYLSVYDNDGQPYETSESVAVNGNYAAYQDILPGFDKYPNDIKLKTYSDLKTDSDYDLIDGSLSEKADDFYNYYNKGGKTAKSGGVQIGTVHAIGASVNGINGTVVKNRTFNIDTDNKTVIDKQNEFATKVLLMNSTKGFNDIASVYNTYDVARTVSGITPVVDFSYYTTHYLDNEKEKLSDKEKEDKLTITTGTWALKNKNLQYVFNANPDNIITIDPTGVHFSKTPDRDSNITIDDKGNINVVIFSNGPVNIDSRSDETKGVHIIGSIISSQDVNIRGDNISIEYNEKRVEYTINEKTTLYPILKSVYGEGNDDGYQTAGTALKAVDVATSTVSDNSFAIQRFSKNNLIEGIWNLKVKSDDK